MRHRYVLPAPFPAGREAAEADMMAQCVWALRREIRSALPGELAERVLGAMEELHGGGDGPWRTPVDATLGADVQRVLAAYNTAKRLHVGSAGWPRSLDGLPEELRARPQTPCDIVEEAAAWWGWGTNTREGEWLGHGMWWRSTRLRPDLTGADGFKVENAAGNSMNDFDLLEDDYLRVKTASVVVADYEALRKAYPDEVGDATPTAIDAFLLRHAAYLSVGQVQRIFGDGGDHSPLICTAGAPMHPPSRELHIDDTARKPAVRMRSGGRAASFLLDDAYWFDEGAPAAGLQARFLEVKGVGTSQEADTSQSEKVTGLLTLADALRDFVVEKFIGRVLEGEGGEGVGTVPCYAILDTGLQYRGTNPATGWTGERVVLLVRAAHNRLLDSYEAMSFAGQVIEDKGKLEGRGRAVRRALIAQGVSAEFFPRALSHLHPDGDGAVQAAAVAALVDDVRGEWNLQMDAAMRRLVDFTDYFVLPERFAPGQGRRGMARWRMSDAAVRAAITLERDRAVAALFDHPSACQYYTSGAATHTNPTEHNPTDAAPLRAARLAQLSRIQAIRDAAAKPTPKALGGGKPEYCMCWFMELDDSDVAQWMAGVCQEYAACDTGAFDGQEAIMRPLSAWLREIE